ncbi:unnamed protein product [Lampetra fluviatilis]
MPRPPRGPEKKSPDAADGAAHRPHGTTRRSLGGDGAAQRAAAGSRPAARSPVVAGAGSRRRGRGTAPIVRSGEEAARSGQRRGSVLEDIEDRREDCRELCVAFCRSRVKRSANAATPLEGLAQLKQLKDQYLDLRGRQEKARRVLEAEIKALEDKV